MNEQIKVTGSPDALLGALLDEIERSGARVIAVDGRCGSGKTTLASALCAKLGCEAVHMDDFFLPPALRTPERLGEAGGNVDYARFAAEVLPHLREEKAFSYRRFDCSKMALGEKRHIGAGSLRVVEGSYAHHPHFGDYADLKVFITTDKDEQMARIINRSGMAMAKRFESAFIPMEEAYFAAFDVEDGADMVLTT